MLQEDKQISLKVIIKNIVLFIVTAIFIYLWNKFRLGDINNPEAVCHMLLLITSGYILLFSWICLHRSFKWTAIAFGVFFFSMLITLRVYINFDKRENQVYKGYFGVLEKKECSGVGGKRVFWFYYKCEDVDSSFVKQIEVLPGEYESSNIGSYYAIIDPHFGLIKNNVSSDLRNKYEHFVLYGRNQIEELGNNSYEYAKYEQEIAYKNYGFNLVFKSHKSIDGIEVKLFDKGTKHIELKTTFEEKDTFLVYSNINPDFYDGWHICPDSLCTPENISKVDSAGYGYLFRGKIYSAAETEKYWNIIEQYKLRNH